MGNHIKNVVTEDVNTARAHADRVVAVDTNNSTNFNHNRQGTRNSNRNRGRCTSHINPPTRESIMTMIINLIHMFLILYIGTTVSHATTKIINKN